MKRTKWLVGLMMAAAMLLSGCGKADGETPEGIYEHNGKSLDFSEDRVVITEGGTSSDCDYTIDKDGELVIDPKGEEIPAQYDAETDTVIVSNVKYRKRAASADQGAASFEEEKTSKAAQQDLPEEEGYNEEMFSDYISLTEDGPLKLYIGDPDYGKADGYIAKYKSNSGEFPDEFIEVYTEINGTGNIVTVVTEDGKERVWVFDEEKGTMSSEGYCFYNYSAREAYFGEKINASKTLEGTYSGIYEGAWRNLTSGAREVIFEFREDHTFDSILDEDRRFLRGQYFIENGYFYTYLKEATPELRAGTYDEATDTIVILGAVLTKTDNAGEATETDVSGQ